MLKGCQKRVVWVRNTESEWFDEAYFVLSEKSVEKKLSEPDIITEANRIISESPFSSYWGLEAERKDRKEKERKANLPNAVGKLRLKWFTFGAAVCAAVSVLIMMMF